MKTRSFREPLSCLTTEICGILMWVVREQPRTVAYRIGTLVSTTMLAIACFGFQRTVASGRGFSLGMTSLAINSIERMILSWGVV